MAAQLACECGVLTNHENKELMQLFRYFRASSSQMQEYQIESSDECTETFICPEPCIQVTFKAIDDESPTGELIDQTTIIHPEETCAEWDYSGICEFPPDMLKATKLQEISLESNMLESIGPSIRELTSLVVLYMPGNRFSTFPVEVCYCTQLREIILDCNNISTIPDAVGNLGCLCKFQLSNNKISTLPKSFEKLTKLEILDFGNNLFRLIPDCIRGLSALKHIVFAGNKDLLEIPSWLQTRHGLVIEWVFLTWLDSAKRSEMMEQGWYRVDEETYVFSMNKVSFDEKEAAVLLRIPDSSTLLDLSFKGFDHLPDLRCYQGHLEELDISSNLIRELPSWIGGFTNLRRLSLGGNLCVNVPENLSLLTSLRTLHLPCNQIADVPSWISDLSELTCLDLSRNNIDNLPATMQHMSKLLELDLSFTCLEKVPKCLFLLTALQGLNLCGTGLIGFPNFIRPMKKLGKKETQPEEIPMGRYPEAMVNCALCSILGAPGMRRQRLGKTKGFRMACCLHCNGRVVMVTGIDMVSPSELTESTAKEAEQPG
uniref:Uncharacterized protein n=1 Tax=Hanusia phi TaxID=3032 RepID=A0A7S0DWI8_9CRYP